MLKKTKKLALNFKILRFFLIPTILVATPFFNKLQDANAGLEFQWDQDSGFRRLKWFQKENRRKFNTAKCFTKVNIYLSSILLLPLNKDAL